jgi:hypothetical protein
MRVLADNAEYFRFAEVWASYGRIGFLVDIPGRVSARAAGIMSHACITFCRKARIVEEKGSDLTPFLPRLSSEPSRRPCHGDASGSCG